MVPALVLVQAFVQVFAILSVSPTASLDVIAAVQVSQDDLQLPEVWVSGHGFEAHLLKSSPRSYVPVALLTLLFPLPLSARLA